LCCLLTVSNNFSLICEIERALKGGVGTAHTKHSKEKIEEYKLEIQEILGVFNPQSSLPGENLAESGTSPAPPSVLVRNTNRSLIRSPFLNVDTPACKRLIKHAFAPYELFSLVEAVFSSKGEGDIVRCLRRGDAQAFIDVIDEVRFYSTSITKSGWLI
jgi:hypothetical protein